MTGSDWPAWLKAGQRRLVLFSRGQRSARGCQVAPSRELHLVQSCLYPPKIYTSGLWASGALADSRRVTIVTQTKNSKEPWLVDNNWLHFQFIL
jgi:hypothetical protein